MIPESRFNEYFGFSGNQLRFLVVLCVVALVLGVYLFVRSYATPGSNPVPLPVFLGNGERGYTGLFLLDPNTAPADSLELLPGIGSVLADRIVEYRQNHRFINEVDITDVRGIGPKLYERLRPYLRIERR